MPGQLTGEAGDLINEFWERTARGELALPVCPACSAPRWYPTYYCPRCGSREDGRWEAASEQAVLWSWTVVRRPFSPEFAEEVPFITAIVELERPRGVRFVTRIVDVGLDQLRIGMKLRLTFLDRGERRLPVFRPVDQ